MQRGNPKTVCNIKNVEDADVFGHSKTPISTYRQHLKIFIEIE